MQLGSDRDYHMREVTHVLRYSQRARFYKRHFIQPVHSVIHRL